jgi:acetyl-CoA acyltransferase 2
MQEIVLGEASVVLTGGTESMSQAPFAVRDMRFGTRLGTDYGLEDMLWAALTDRHIKTPMGVTAENLAEKYKITRQETDEFAYSSQMKWKAGKESFLSVSLSDLLHLSRFRSLLI